MSLAHFPICYRRTGALAFAASCALVPAVLNAQAADPAATPAPAATAADAASAPMAPTAPPSVSTLPAVRVNARAERESATGPVIGYTARRSATATKTDTPLNEVPQSISVITADQVRDQSSPNMQEVLRYSAGVRNELYGVDNRGDYFSMRGGSEASVLLDGLRLPLTGLWGVIRNEPYAFERIEVLRGPASVIAGQNGPGGVVNLVSKRPQAEAANEVQVQAGTHDHKQAAIDLTGPLDTEGRLLYRLVALHKDSGTQVNHAVDERTYLAPSLSWRPSAGTHLNVYAQYQKDTTGNTNAFFPIEGTLRPAPNGPIPSDTFIGEPDWDRYGGERKRFGYMLEQQLGDDWTLRHNLRHDRTEGYIRTMYAKWWEGFVNADGTPNTNGRYLDRMWYASDDHSTVTNTDLLLEGKLNLGSTRHTLLAGVDAMRGKWHKVDYGEGDATPLDVYSPVYGSFPLPDLAASSMTDSRVRNLGVLVQDQIRFDDRFVVVAGLRRDRVRISGDNEQNDSATSKNLGGVYLAPNGVSPYVNYSESFEPVAPRAATPTRPAQAFSPKRGKQLEAGVKWAPEQQRFTVSTAVYELRETNRVTDGPTPTAPQQQLGEVTVKGFEIEGSTNLPAWDIVAQYTYMDARETSDVPDRAAYLGKQLAGIPRHSAAVWAVHKFDRLGLPGIRAGAGVRYVGNTADELGDNGVPSVALYDLLLAYDRGPWRLAFNVSNLTNKTYLATCLSRRDCWFGPQRRGVLSVAYRW